MVLFLKYLSNCVTDPGKCIFKLVYQSGPDFKKYMFETDASTTADIVKKVQIILEMHSTNACKEFQLYREKKLLKKAQKSQSFNKG